MEERTYHVPGLIESILKVGERGSSANSQSPGRPVDAVRLELAQIDRQASLKISQGCCVSMASTSGEKGDPMRRCKSDLCHKHIRISLLPSEYWTMYGFCYVRFVRRANSCQVARSVVGAPTRGAVVEGGAVWKRDDCALRPVV